MNEYDKHEQPENTTGTEIMIIIGIMTLYILFCTPLGQAFREKIWSDITNLIGMI